MAPTLYFSLCKVTLCFLHARAAAILTPSTTLSLRFENRLRSLMTSQLHYTYISALNRVRCTSSSSIAKGGQIAKYWSLNKSWELHPWCHFVSSSAVYRVERSAAPYCPTFMRLLRVCSPDASSKTPNHLDRLDSHFLSSVALRMLLNPLNSNVIEAVESEKDKNLDRTGYD